MTTEKKVTFKSLLFTGTIGGLLMNFMLYFFSQPDQFNWVLSGLTFCVFMAVFTAILCWMYEINPIKSRWNSPYK